MTLVGACVRMEVCDPETSPHHSGLMLHCGRGVRYVGISERRCDATTRSEGVWYGDRMGVGGGGGEGGRSVRARSVWQ